ncbi:MULTISPECIES: XRE family transcriptional regulator [Proteiniclasticum]|uniref:LexA family protein n=1 Tax=Proteiniclasticum TaxID=1155385 RepID=UPI00289E77D3|nr:MULTISPECIES: XRE family transcriptional regulator [Proteiniclasticum]
MATSTHAGDFFKELRLSRGLSQRGLAMKMGVSHSTISKIENGERSPKLELLMKYSDALKVDLTYLVVHSKGDYMNPIIPKMNEEDRLKFEDELINVDLDIKVPIVGTVKAGTPILAVENIEDHVLVDRNRLPKNKTYYALKVKGDSMDKVFKEGSIIIVEKTDLVDNKDIAVVGINGNEATVKRVMFSDDDHIALIPESFNPAHTTQVIFMPDSEVHILGKVIQSISFF